MREPVQRALRRDKARAQLVVLPRTRDSQKVYVRISMKKTKSAKAVSAPEEPKISGPHVARSLDKDPATIRRWVREGCPCYPIASGMTLFKISEVIAWRATRPSFQSKEY